MDLIVGLPGDTYETFCDTIEKVIALDPENVTVHSLALKRSSFITQSGEINKGHADAALGDRTGDDRSGARKADGRGLEAVLSLSPKPHGGQFGEYGLGKAGHRVCI